MPIIDPRDFDRALEGLDFPASRDAVLRTAADKGGINGNVLVVLRHVPDQSFDSRAQLDAAIAAAQGTIGDGDGLASAEPAAPADPELKDAVAANADTRAPASKRP